MVEAPYKGMTSALYRVLIQGLLLGLLHGVGAFIVNLKTPGMSHAPGSFLVDSYGWFAGLAVQLPELETALKMNKAIV